MAHVRGEQSKQQGSTGLYERQPDDQLALLAWCAVLHQFDEATLAALPTVAPATIAALLASNQLEIHIDAPRTFRLRESVQHAALAHLRQHTPHAERVMHQQAFAYFRDRLAQPDPAANPAHIVARCLAHLTALHDFSIEFVEWHAISEPIAVLRAAQPNDLILAHWLEFFEAYVELRTNAPEQGAQRLATLLALPDLEAALHLRVLHAMGIALADSHFDEALHHYEATYQLASTCGDQARQCYVLLSIAMVYTDLSRYHDALNYSERSLVLARSLGAVYREAHALYEMGNNLMHLGRWDQARAVLNESVTIYARLGATKRLSMPLWALGTVYQMLGDDSACEAAYQRALAIARTASTIIPSIAIDSLSRLGLLYQTQEHYDQASRMYTEAVALAEQHNYRHWEAMYRYWLAEALRRNGQIDAAVAAYRRALHAVEALRSATEIEAIKLSLLGTTQYLYESMVLFCLDHASPAEAFGYMERARTRAFLDKLAQQSSEHFTDAAQQTVELAELQAQLAFGDLVLEYFTIGMLPHGDHWLNTIPASNRRLREHLVPPAQIVLFAITQTTIDVYRIAVDPNRLRPSIHSDDPVLQTLRVDGTVRWLYDRLIAPAAHLLNDCRQLYLVPHGPLHYIPFAALRAPNGTYLLHADGPAIALATSATLLLRCCLARQPSQAIGALAIGFNDQAGQALEHAEAEAQIIAELIGGEHWTGPSPKRQRLLQAAPRLRWLHIASHATYDRQASLTSSLRLGENDDLDVETIMGDLHLNADLVTLSACMSGFGQVVPGDELLGLQRALLLAGTPTVVCTLAKARDTVALLVMKRFYTRLLEGQAAAAALRDALVAVRSMTRAAVQQELEQVGYRATLGDLHDPASPLHADEYPFARPEYWAPFILVGRP